MATPIFVNGLPAKITRDFFRSRYGQNFPNLLPTTMNDFLDDAIGDVYTMFAGVNELWRNSPNQLWFDKAQMCYGLLTAWYIADLYPEHTAGVVMMGGIPVKQKSIGGIKISFGSPDKDGSENIKGYIDLLAPLKSNPFGYKAYNMIRSAARLTNILGRRKPT